MVAAASPGWLGFPAASGDPAPQTLSCLTRPGSTTSPTATTTTTMAWSLQLLAFLVIVTSTAGQISFGGGRELKRQEKVVKEEKVLKVLSTKPKLLTVNFASNKRKKKMCAGSGGIVSLAELLEGEQQLLCWPQYFHCH